MLDPAFNGTGIVDIDGGSIEWLDAVAHANGRVTAIALSLTSPVGQLDANIRIIDVDPDGDAVYTFVGDTLDDQVPGAIALDPLGRTFITGSVSDYYDDLLLRGPFAGGLPYKSYMGGGSYEVGRALTFGLDGSAIIAGETREDGSGNRDLFVCRVWGE